MAVVEATPKQGPSAMQVITIGLDLAKSVAAKGSDLNSREVGDILTRWIDTESNTK